MPHHRKVFKKFKLDYTSEQDTPKTVHKTPQESRMNYYFKTNGYCVAHDSPACCQCKKYVLGVCPSYWEEYC